MGVPCDLGVGSISGVAVSTTGCAVALGTGVAVEGFLVETGVWVGRGVAVAVSGSVTGVCVGSCVSVGLINGDGQHGDSVLESFRVLQARLSLPVCLRQNLLRHPVAQPAGPQRCYAA